MLDALTTPANVLVPAAVLAAGAFTGIVWLFAAALVCWLALSGLTLREACEAPRAELAPEIRARLRAARATGDAVKASGWPALDAEVDALVAALEDHAQSAQRIHAFLAERPRRELERRIARHPGSPVALCRQLSALDRLQARLDDLLDEMDGATAALDTLHAEVLAAGAVDSRTAARRVAELRASVELISDGLEEAFAETRTNP
jgi:hypothetical protein